MTGADQILGLNQDFLLGAISDPIGALLELYDRITDPGQLINKSFNWFSGTAIPLSVDYLLSGNPSDPRTITGLVVNI
ncbi:MAG: hypothetical protein ACTSW1_12185 [Candidatus Hodarchaeales archaeon]